MKEMSKAKIIDKKSEKSILSERDFLSKMKHKFIVNMHYSFQDKDNLYLVLDLLTGGDLRYHICKTRHFNQEQAQFIIACIIVGLEYCHFNRLIHRDIKPENLVFDQNGYLKITDFGIAKIQEGDNSKETSGTPGYMAPEVMCAQEHNVAVDSFALGIIGYELMFERRPYLGKSRKEIKEKIIAHQAQIRKSEIPPGWTIEAADCINRLIKRKPWDRLGFNGAHEIKEHIWFRNFSWRDLYLGKLISPYIPPDEDNFDHRYCNAIENQRITTLERYQTITNQGSFKYVFCDYLYLNREIDPNTASPLEQKTNKPYINLHEELYTINHSKPGHHRNFKSQIEASRPQSSNNMHQRNNSQTTGSLAFIAANTYVNKRDRIKKTFGKINCKFTMSMSNFTFNHSTGLLSNK